LRKVEEAVQALTNAVTQAADAINHPSTNCQRGSENNREPHEAIDVPSNLSVGDVDSFSFIKDTSITNATVGSSPLHQHAAKELQYLSHSLTAAVASKEHPATGFYIPSRAEGYQMIGRNYYPLELAPSQLTGNRFLGKCQLRRRVLHHTFRRPPHTNHIQT
jgi:hypothetical protein